MQKACSYASVFTSSKRLVVSCTVAWAGRGDLEAILAKPGIGENAGIVGEIWDNHQLLLIILPNFASTVAVMVGLYRGLTCHDEHYYG
jgi:hypothetical protein